MMCNTSEGRMAAQRRTRNLPTAYMSDVHLPSLPRLKNKPQLLQYPGICPCCCSQVVAANDHHVQLHHLVVAGMFACT